MALWPKGGNRIHCFFQSGLGEISFQSHHFRNSKCRSGGEDYVGKLLWLLPATSFYHQLPEVTSCLETFGQGGGVLDSVPGLLAGTALQWPQVWNTPVGRQLVSLSLSFHLCDPASSSHSHPATNYPSKTLAEGP